MKQLMVDMCIFDRTINLSFVDYDNLLIRRMRCINFVNFNRKRRI